MSTAASQGDGETERERERERGRERGYLKKARHYNSRQAKVDKAAKANQGWLGRLAASG